MKAKNYLFLVMISFSFPFTSVLTSSSKSKATFPTKIVTTPVRPQTTTVKLSKPIYRNVVLEKRIAKEKTGTSLDLGREELTSQDMEIVAYYGLYNNKVSVIIFYVIIGE